MIHSVTIIGAGVAGLCVARALKDRGAEVTLIDRETDLGIHACSWWAGGMLAPFCEGESAEEPVVRLGQEAAPWWQAKTDAVINNGSLVVSLARDKNDLKRFSRRTEQFEEISSTQVQALEPDLGNRFQKGLYFSSEAHLAPRRALAELRATLLADGVTFIQEDADLDAYAQKGITIDCRGYQARDSMNDLRGVKGEMLVLSCPDVTLHRPIRCRIQKIDLYILNFLIKL